MAYIKKIFTAYNYLSIYLLLIFPIDLLLQFIPLTNVLGYEYSAANSILLSFLSALYFIRVYERFGTNENRKDLIKYLTIGFSSFILLPLLISITHSIFSISCSICDGLLFYTVLTIPSIIVGASLGLISLNLSKRSPVLIFILLYIAILSIPFFEFYFNPQIYFYNSIFGFFPGTIYDEGLNVGSSLIIYRLLNTIFFGTLFFLLINKSISVSKIRSYLLMSAALVIAAVFLFVSPAFNFSTNFDKLNKALKNEVVTEHFVIHFSEQINPDLLKAVCLSHEYYYAELSKFFGFKMTHRINSYIFYDDAQKKELIGSANADIAKPWLRCTFTSLSDYGETLRHEIAHCFTSKFGRGIFKIAGGMNPALIEGAAVAGDPYYDEHTIDYMAALAYRESYKINLPGLYGGFSFYTQTSSLSYVYAGSFSKYLISNYGIKKFENFYESNNFKKVYGTDIKNTVHLYYQYLDSLKLNLNSNKANYYFGWKSIFYKVCPRYVANILANAWGYYNSQEYTKAEKLFTDVQKLTNNYSGLTGLTDCLVKENKFLQAAGLLRKKIGEFKNTSYYYGIELKLADIDVLTSNESEADSLYKALLEQNPNRRYVNLSNLRISLMKSDSLLKTYIAGNNYDRFIILRDLNETKYDYSSIPPFIDLAKYFNISYAIIKQVFSKPFAASNIESSYALYKISDFMFEHLDFQSAQKTAALALKYNDDPDFNIFLNENIKKINWCNSHSTYILAHTKF